MSKSYSKTLINFITITGLSACIFLTIWAWRMGILTSETAMEQFISEAGVLAPILFIILQIVQVVVPIIPGGVSCLVGVLMFGPIEGFIYNYIGICIGSMFAFGISKNYGRPFMEKMFSENSIAKYEAWTSTNNRFSKLFAFAIFFPVAPDDLLCFLAGTTSMSWKRFTAIILLCKPSAISIYSLGLTVVYQQVISFIGG